MGKTKKALTFYFCCYLLQDDQRDGEDNEARAPPAPLLRRHVSPPKRDDDREGHYVFNLGENLTPRCNSNFCFIVFSILLFVLGPSLQLSYAVILLIFSFFVLH